MAVNYKVWCYSYFSSADAKEWLIHNFLAEWTVHFVVKVKLLSSETKKRKAMLVSTGICYFNTHL